MHPATGFVQCSSTTVTIYLCEATAIPCYCQTFRHWLPLCGVRQCRRTGAGGAKYSAGLYGLVWVVGPIHGWVIMAEDTGPADACNGACFWHRTLPDGTRKAAPSQPSRVAHGAVDPNRACVPCCKPAGMRMRNSGLIALLHSSC
jgi:hypothetical protein